MGFLALPYLKPKYQAFGFGLIRSFVGSADATEGTVWPLCPEQYPSFVPSHNGPGDYGGVRT